MNKFVNYLITIVLAVVPLASYAHLNVEQITTLSSTIPGGPLFGDNFGQTVYLHKDQLFVSALLARPDPSKDAEGAIYIYKKTSQGWENTQIILTDGMSDHLGALQIKVRDNWLFISAIGTPIGPIENDLVVNQDFTGSIRIYHYNKDTGLWNFHQSIDRNTPGLSNLSVIDPAALQPIAPPPFAVSQGGNFGLSFDLTPCGKHLIVGAPHQSNIDSQNTTAINSGRVYIFDLIHDDWVLTQEITNPDGILANDNFGSTIKIHKNYAFISNAHILISIPIINNSVYVYKYDEGQWNFIQKLKGDQTTLTPINIPAFGGVIPAGDGFGTSIACDGKWLLISAPTETLGAAEIKGAAYFYRLEKSGSSHLFVRKQKVVSDDPNVFFTGISVAMDDGIALIGDQIHTGPSNNLAQGALLVYKLHKGRWKKKIDLFDNQGFPFEFLGGGVDIKDNTIVAGSGSSVVGLFSGFFFTPPLLPVPLPLPPGKVVIWEIKSGSN